MILTVFGFLAGRKFGQGHNFVHAGKGIMGIEDDLSLLISRVDDDDNYKDYVLIFNIDHPPVRMLQEPTLYTPSDCHQ